MSKKITYVFPDVLTDLDVGLQRFILNKFEIQNDPIFAVNNNKIAIKESFYIKNKKKIDLILETWETCISFLAEEMPSDKDKQNMH